MDILLGITGYLLVSEVAGAVVRLADLSEFIAKEKDNGKTD